MTAILSISSHAILDALAALTYHPVDASLGDRFWLGYHAGVVALSLKVWKQNQQQHKWTMICSVLPDLDWVFIKIPGVIGIRNSILQRPILHELVFEILYLLPRARLLEGLPNLRHKKAAVILELILYTLLSRVNM